MKDTKDNNFTVEILNLNINGEIISTVLKNLDCNTYMILKALLKEKYERDNKMTIMNIINEFQDQYRFLSNFYPAQIFYKGIMYASAEHAYMSAKSDDLLWKEFCATEPRPGNVKRASRKLELSDTWDNDKLRVMEEVLRIKFSDPDLRKMLDATKGKELREGNRWNDRFWGVNLSSGEGQNHLGKILMKIRDEENG